MLCITGCSTTPWTGPVTSQGQYYLELEHDGLTRSYQLHVPANYTGEISVPLHFDIHPRYANAYLMEWMTDMRSASDTSGFILVQPNGIDDVGGIAVVVGSMGYDSLDQCQPSIPVPVLMISGGDDNLASREETFSRWLVLNNCQASTSESIGVFTCETFTDCDAGVETTHCVGAGVGHCWPGTSFFFYGCNRDLDASRYILDFFARINSG